MPIDNMAGLFRSVADAAYDAQGRIDISPVADPNIQFLYDTQSFEQVIDIGVNYDRFTWVSHQWAQDDKFVGP